MVKLPAYHIKFCFEVLCSAGSLGDQSYVPTWTSRPFSFLITRMAIISTGGTMDAYFGFPKAYQLLKRDTPEERHVQAIPLFLMV